MSTQIVIPNLGESISQGVIASWRKKDGDVVQRDETILELETDKITVEVPAPAAGVVHPKAKEGETVEVGAVVGTIDESGAGAAKAGAGKGAAAAPAAKESAGKKNSGAGGVKKGSPAATAERAEPKPAARSAGAPAGAAVGTGDNGEHGADVRATPLARKIADERGVDISHVAGTGPGGRIREQDVLAYLQSRPEGRGAGPVAPGAPAVAASGGAAVSTVAAAPGSRRVTVERMSPLRQRIAARLVEAQHTAAMLTTFNECDMTAVMEARKRHKEAFEKAHGVGLGFMSFFVKACVNGLTAFPRVNSQIVQAEGGPAIQSHHYCDIAVAVSTPKGLVVPVLRNCEALSFAQIEQGIKDLAERAKAGKLTLEEMQGGTFTITNGGIYGSMLSTPILNPPQSGILGMHNIVRRPVENPAKPGSGEVAVRPMMYIALSYDHRVIDGAEAVSFLKRVKECIEDPERMLVGV